MTTNNAVNSGLSGTTGSGNFVGSTSPTLVTPTIGVASATSIKFSNGNGVLDNNGNNLLLFNVVASAVNYINITNAIASSNPLLDANGTDSAVSMNLRTKNGDFLFSDSTGTKAPLVKYFNAAGTKAVSLRAATALGSDVSFILPTADAAGALVSDGSGNLSLTTTITTSAWTDFSGTIGYTGFTGTPTTSIARYKLIGKTLFFFIAMTGTSNATTFTITGMPVAALGGVSNEGGFVSSSDNSTFITNANWQIGGGTTTITMLKGNNPSGWTNSGTKSVTFQGFYETA